MRDKALLASLSTLETGAASATTVLNFRFGTPRPVMGLFGKLRKNMSSNERQDRDRAGPDVERAAEEQIQGPRASDGSESNYNQRAGVSNSLLNSNGSIYRNGGVAPPQSDGTPYDVRYGHTRVFVGADHGVILDRVQGALARQGFRVLSCVDLQHTLKSSKVSCGDFRRYTIMTACHPKLLYKGVFEEPSLGLMPPSNVVVMEGDFNKSDIVVQVTKPSTIYKALHNQSPKLRGILSETDARLKIALDYAARQDE
ncbi:hypothetical protein WJX73_002875 [Symbiochloris irregularis]|uniref:DUF302 domain-containing protein n=1 Tax=Symbiochloris irregularis TaxID=706552 RepID=A0AAW1P0W4_9CHLO